MQEVYCKPGKLVSHCGLILDALSYTTFRTREVLHEIELE